jgi:hypothetical protein
LLHRPYFELCVDHQGHPGTPCYFLKQLPLELRCEVYRYLLPTESIGSSTAAVHQESYDEPYIFRATNRPMLPPPPFVPSGLPPPLVAAFPMRLTDLLLVSRQIHDEVKDLLFSVVTFKIDVRKDGAFMCGRRLLEPKRADGSSHMMAEAADKAKKKFLKSFDWASVKNYTVDILLENSGDAYSHINRGLNITWDEEVEIYDIKGTDLMHTLEHLLMEADYVSVVVSGILAKSKKLCKLQVRLGLDDFQWDEYQILTNSKLLFSPFERLRNVRQPSIGGVFDGRPNNNSVYCVIPGTSQIYSAPTGHYENCCSVPSLPTNKPMLAANMPAFDAYAAEWKRQISSDSSTAITEEPPIRKMFAEFRNFYTELANHVPDVTFRSGKHTFLHQARVAREQEDVIAFRGIRNELIHYWEAYKADEERKKREMNKRLGKLLESDMYPSHEWEDMSSARPQSPSGQTAQSPVLLDSDKMAQEGIPMTGNSGETRSYTSEQYVRMMRVQQQKKQSQIHAPAPGYRHVANGSTSVPRRSHPTLSNYTHQHQQMLQTQQQAQQQAQQQIKLLQIQQQQHQARYHALSQQSRNCLAKLTELKNQKSTIRQRANQVLSLLRTKQHAANPATLQQIYKQQASGITLAVLEAQRKFDEIEREKRFLKKSLTATTATAGMPMNTMVEGGVKKDKRADASEYLEKKESLGLMREEEQKEEEEDSPDTLDNEDLYSDPFHDNHMSVRATEGNATSETQWGFGSNSAATTITTTTAAAGDTTIQSSKFLAGVKRGGCHEVLEERVGEVELEVGGGVGVPGPSTTKKRRIDSGYRETMECSMHENSNDEWKGVFGGLEGVSQQHGGEEWKGLVYVGKGKGRMDDNGDAEIVPSWD